MLYISLPAGYVQVQLGREYQCPGRMDGAPLKQGFDSHRSPDKTELVVFSKDQILPLYIVRYTIA